MPTYQFRPAKVPAIAASFVRFDSAELSETPISIPGTDRGEYFSRDGELPHFAHTAATVYLKRIPRRGGASTSVVSTLTGSLEPVEVDLGGDAGTGSSDVLTASVASGTYLTVVVHGADANVARPASAVAVRWIGSVEPVNMANTVDELIAVA